MPESENIQDADSNTSAADLQKQRIEWRRKSWTIPDLRGGKQSWLSLVKSLVSLVESGQATDLDACPNISGIPDPQPWRSYAGFLKGAGLVSNQAGILHLSDIGIKFHNNSTPKQLADILQDRIRLFAETLEIIASTPATVESVNEQLCRKYALDWANLSNTRRRMDWLEVLDLIEGLGDRKWGATAAGKTALDEWCLVSPDALESLDSDSEDSEIPGPPVEIALLLQNLSNSPEAQKKRNTYNIWVPSPNRIENLRVIIQTASERITRADFFSFIEEEFHLKQSSAESMLPFLKASGLLEEVGRGVYSATVAARAWLETGNDLDFIRILHANMRFVGEMIAASSNDIVRNDLYTQAEAYGLNTEIPSRL